MNKAHKVVDRQLTLNSKETWSVNVSLRRPINPKEYFSYEAADFSGEWVRLLPELEWDYPLTGSADAAGVWACDRDWATEPSVWSCSPGGPAASARGTSGPWLSGNKNTCQTERYWSGPWHGIKGFVIPTKSFVKLGTTKILCYNNKMFSTINKTFGCCSKIFGCSNKKFICCPLFCCRNKTIFFRGGTTRWADKREWHVFYPRFPGNQERLTTKPEIQ